MLAAGFGVARSKKKRDATSVRSDAWSGPTNYWDLEIDIIEMLKNRFRPPRAVSSPVNGISHQFEMRR
jgi:hypothetical protein